MCTIYKCFINLIVSRAINNVSGKEKLKAAEVEEVVETRVEGRVTMDRQLRSEMDKQMHYQS